MSSRTTHAAGKPENGIAMSVWRRIGSFLLLIGCSTMVIGGGALPGYPPIGGHMFNDANGNGVKDPGEVGIAEREIHVFDRSRAPYSNPARSLDFYLP